jgi:hypothetical protein
MFLISEMNKYHNKGISSFNPGTILDWGPDIFIIIVTRLQGADTGVHVL